MEFETRMLQDKWAVRGSRLLELEQAEKDLVRAKALIKRQRALIAVLQDERKDQRQVVNDCFHHRSVTGNFHKKWGIAFLAHRLGISIERRTHNETHRHRIRREAWPH